MHCDTNWIKYKVYTFLCLIVLIKVLNKVLIILRYFKSLNSKEFNFLMYSFLFEKSEIYMFFTIMYAY